MIEIRPQVLRTLPQSEKSPESQILPGVLHGKDIGNGKHRYDTEVLMQKPIHKMAAKLVALCVPDKEICEIVGFSKSTLFELLRTPWFMEEVKELMDGGNDTMALLKAAGPQAALTIIEICQDEKAPKSVRLAAGKEILDRNLGKSLTTIESKVQHSSGDPVADVANLEAEVARLRQNAGQAIFQSLPS